MAHSDSHVEKCTLVIVGAGYAGICAFNAAVQYLKPGDRIVVVDQGKTWGGQWIDQYDFVRLHQPYSIFTAGQRKWAFADTKKPMHLATKPEILAHFQDIATAALGESKVELVPLFRHSYTGHAIENGEVVLTAAYCGDNGMLPLAPKVTIRAQRLIKATGFDIQMKRPLPCQTSRVVSLCPADVLQPAWNAAMRTTCRDKPIYIIGSGKTAMDCIYHLTKNDPGAVYRDRVFCVSGRGMLFASRDMMFPQGGPSVVISPSIHSVPSDFCLFTFCVWNTSTRILGPKHVWNDGGV
jgi:hypothetical protein